MNIFGEEYDLSKCTPEEQAQVQAWYEANKDQEVPVAADSPRGTMLTEDKRSKSMIPSDPLDIVLALESLKSNPNFNPELQGKTQHVDLYKMVHPLGGNMTVEDAAKQLGINKVTAYRWLNKLVADNPESADLFKWPTKKQLDAYRLIHPELGGLTAREAAKALECTVQHVYDLLARMRKSHPNAFSFERTNKPKVVRYDPSVHDDTAVEKF